MKKLKVTPSFRRNRAFALLSVLMVMALLIGLMTTMMLRTRVEANASARSSTVARAGALADMAVNLVLSQITSATRENNTSWTSQPGALWTFHTDGFSRGYKLYSDSTMRVSDEDSIVSDAPPADWNSEDNRLRYVDLNEPVIRGAEAYFPIIDPRTAPSAFGGSDGIVDGFDFDTSLNGSVHSTTTTARLPMPVEWLYLLKDGSYGVLDAAGTYQSLSGQPMDKSTNPITGRIAFWTDDESSKLNINTASEGTYWDSPRVTTVTDRDSLLSYTYSVPGIREYQRYPGHPAGVSLNPALKNWFPVTATPSGATHATVRDMYASQISKVFDVIPRISFGSSKGGAVYNTSGQTAQYSTLIPDTDRLFVNADELIFQAKMTGGEDNRRVGQVLTANNTPAELASMASRNHFFLTANSRAPDTTIFETPRIAMFSQLLPDGGRTGPVMGLLGFCSKIGGKDYYFQRKKSWSDGASCYSSTEDIKLPGNTALLKYLRDLTSRDIPGAGVGGNFKAKYGSLGRDQLLTETLDYLRSSVNVYSASDGTDSFSTSWVVPMNVSAESGEMTMGFGRCTTVTEAALILYVSGVEGTDTDGDGWIKQNEATAVKIKGGIVFETYLPSANLITVPEMVINVEFDKPFTVAGTNLNFKDGELKSSIHPHISSGQSRTPMIGLYELLAGYRSWGTDFANNIVRYPFVSLAEARVPANQSTVSLNGGSFTVSLKSKFGEIYQTIKMEYPSTTVDVPTPKFNYDGLTPLKDIAADKQPGWFHFGSRIARSVTYDANPDPYNNSPSYFNGMIDRLVRQGDTVRSLELLADGPSGGDVRMAAALHKVPKNFFGVHSNYYSSNVRQVQSLSSSEHGCNTMWWQEGIMSEQIGYFAESGLIAPPHYSNVFGIMLMDNRLMFESPVPDLPINDFSPKGVPLVMRSSLTGTSAAVPKAGFNQFGRAGDFDSGIGITPDGCYIGKTDETMTGDTWSNWWESGWYGTGTSNHTTYTPNRQVASPVKLGSLPTGISATDPKPWQTLLFCPNPPGRQTASTAMGVTTDHFGAKTPPDHLWLDMFTMPVVEPWAVSEPLSTAGRVNLNHRLAPFSHITRTTALLGVLRSTRLQAVVTKYGRMETDGAATYKTGDHRANSPTAFKFDSRYDINPKETLVGFKRRFDGLDGKGRRIFLTPSEICEIFLVPAAMRDSVYGDAKTTVGLKYEDMTDWWNKATTPKKDNAFGLTGDNMREEPYNRLYPLVTTKSNTFQVHYRVQALSFTRSDKKGADAFTVSAEQRGSTIVERYVNPSDKDIPDYTIDSATQPGLGKHYKFRFISNRRFQP